MRRLGRLRTLTIGTIVFVLILALTLPASGYKGATHQHRGWVRYTIAEQFGYMATETYIMQQYYQDTGSVWNSRYVTGYCKTSAFPGWVINRCDKSIDEVTGSWVGINIWGEFHWPLVCITFGCEQGKAIDYEQHSYNYAYGGGAFYYSCHLDHGSLPPAWDEFCFGGRENV